MRIIAIFVFALSSLAYAQGYRLALNWKPEAEFGGFYEAQRLALFDEIGLEILEGGANQPIAAMVANGKVEMGTISGDELLMIRDKGADLVAIFAVFQTHPQGIMVHKSTNAQSFADVFQSGKIKTLAMANLPYAKFLRNKFASDSSLSPKFVPFNGGIASFLHDENFAQQCFVTSEPVLAKRAQANPISLLVADSGFNPYATVIVTKRNFLEKERQKLKKLVAAFKTGWLSYLQHPDKTNALMAKMNVSLTLEDLKQTVALMHPLVGTSENFGQMTETRWLELAKQLFELDLVRNPIDSEKVFENL